MDYKDILKLFGYSVGGSLNGIPDYEAELIMERGGQYLKPLELIKLKNTLDRRKKPVEKVIRRKAVTYIYCNELMEVRSVSDWCKHFNTTTVKNYKKNGFVLKGRYTFREVELHD